VAHDFELTELKKRFTSAEKIDSIVFRNGRWDIHASYGSALTSCPSCNGLLAHHDWSLTRFLDSPAFDKQVVRLYARRPRFRCRECRKTVTPAVFGLAEKHRVTDRLVRYIVENLYCSNSVRELASSVGSTAKTITEILDAIAEQARKGVVSPVDVRIHELRLSEDRHLILLDLANGAVVDFFPAHPQQLTGLSDYLVHSNELAAIQVVSIPADRAILKLVASACPSARIDLPISEIHSSLARFVATHGASGSRRGKPGSISGNESTRLAVTRRTHFSREDTVRYNNGLCNQNEFWQLYDAKEQLLYKFEQAAGQNWGNLFKDWHTELSIQAQLASHELKSFFTEAERFGVKFRIDPAKPLLIMHIDQIQKLLLKPGTSFSVEMISALVFSFRAFKEPKSIGFEPTNSDLSSLEFQRAIFWIT
jgi:transposase-like protein